MRPLNIERQPAAVGREVLRWRWPLLAATAVLVLWQVGPTTWSAALLLPLVAGMSVVHHFRPSVFRRWLTRGYVILADALLVGLTLLGIPDLPSGVLVGFFSALLIAVLVADRLKSLLACFALVAILFALGGTLPALQGSVAFTSVPLFLAAGLAFGSLAEQLRRHPTAADASPAGRERMENDELWTLLEIADTIGSTLDVTEVMRAVVQRVGDLIETDSCSILLADPKLRTCFVVASKGHPDVDMLELDLQKYPEVRKAIETREPVVIEDVENSPLVAAVREVLLEKGYRSLLVLPLLFGKEVLGTLFLRVRREQPLTPDEIRFCKVTAGVSANALKNALLFRDVAEEAESHRATGEKLRRLLDGTPDMIVAVDANGRIAEFNRGAEELTGRGAREMMGKSLTDMFGQRDLGAAENDPEVPLDVALWRADGEKREISLAGAPLRDADGETTGRVWIGRDVTKLRQVEKSLTQAERLSSLGEVVAGVAHELNNPLSGVVGYAELLRNGATDPGQLRDLDRIVESSMRCQKIVLKLLSFARRQPAEKRNQNLNDCVRKVLDLKSYHLRSSRIETVLELDETLPSTYFDTHQLEQVILNLLNNAEQAVASTRVNGRIVMRTGRDGDSVYCEVTDNGPGVPTEVRERVFDPFFTTKDVGQGTGLGLSVSYGIVREHGGRIELSPAEEAGGACFRLSLPIVQGLEPRETEENENAFSQDGQVLAGTRILVAEDEPVVLELFNRLLDEVGVDVTLARDGQEAWDHLDSDDFDLIVADLRMPNLDGRQLYERVAEERPELLRRFVFATGDLVRQESLSFLRDLPNRILTKPLQIETVRRVLSQALNAAN